MQTDVQIRLFMGESENQHVFCTLVNSCSFAQLWLAHDKLSSLTSLYSLYTWLLHCGRLTVVGR